MTAAGSMLARTARLTDGREIRSVSRSGARARSGDIAVSISKPVSGRPTRGCVIVGKPTGNAVLRNRQRRRLRHALAELAPGLPAGVEIVVRGGPAVVALTSVELRRDLGSALSRAARRGEIR